MRRKNKFYAVSIGRKPGLYRRWPEAETQVLYVSGNLHESFATEQSAQAFLEKHGQQVQRWNRDGVIVAKSRGCCWYCGKQLTGHDEDFGNGELEHQIPRARGGPGTLDNLVLACRQCNQEKSAQTVEEFRIRIHTLTGRVIVFFGESLPGDDSTPQD